MSRSKKLKIIILTITLSLFGIGFLYFSNDRNSSEGEELVKGASVETDSSVSVFEDKLVPIYGTPRKVTIDSVGLNVSVVPVGVTEDGYMETPSDWNLAGWYRKSAKPSEVGNLIINAHYDDSGGNPAAFWELKNVSLGDRVTVLDSYGRIYDYKVTNFYYLDVNDPERLQVFEDEGFKVPALTLITCSGVFFPSEGTYNKRLIVNAELVL